jgi:hypothetical protein
MGNISAHNLRYNPFTQAFTAYGYGYSGNPKEVHTIPSSSPYWIYLNEIPREDSPSTLFINEQGGSSFTEVSFTTSPAANQFRVVYGGDGTTTEATAGQGIVEFNSADAGKIVEVKYYALGSIVQNSFLNDVLDGDYGIPHFEKGFTGENNDFYTTFKTQVGNDLNIPGISRPFVTALSDKRVAYIDETNDDLRTYEFDGTNWSQIGNDLNIAGITGGAAYSIAIAALSESRIAFIDVNNEDLRTYDFDGTDWSQTGNDLNISGISTVSLAALTSSRVALVFGTSLRVYDFDGTDWSQTGNTTTLTGLTSNVITTLSSTRIALLSQVGQTLRAYDFDGTDFSLVGEALAVTVNSVVTITSLSNIRVVTFDRGTGDELKIYRFNDVEWQVDFDNEEISGAGDASIAAMRSSRIAFIDQDNEDLRAYDLYYERKVPTPPFI